MLKWKKLTQQSWRRNQHYEFWDGTDKEGFLVCSIRRTIVDETFSVFGYLVSVQGLDAHNFKSLKEAKAHVIAWLVSQRLEES
jgi:hypothetical protein